MLPGIRNAADRRGSAVPLHHAPGAARWLALEAGGVLTAGFCSPNPFPLLRNALMETSAQPTAPTPSVKSFTGRREAARSTKASPTQSPHVDTQSPRVETSSDEPRITRIARRAHELYMTRGSNDGHDIDDWLQAEREIDEESDARSR
jgi:hypothetical protein